MATQAVSFKACDERVELDALREDGVAKLVTIGRAELMSSTNESPRVSTPSSPGGLSSQWRGANFPGATSPHQKENP